MRAISAKLNMHWRGVSVLSGDMGRITLRFVLTSFGVLAFLYVLLLGNMVVNIVERKSLETRARSLSAEVAELEVAYLASSSKIDLNFSRSLGFREASPAFATRKTLGLKSSESSENIKVSPNDI